MKRTNTLSNVVTVAALAALAVGYTAVATRTHAAAAPLAAAAAQQQGNEFRWREGLAAGKVLEIKGVNGNVEATPSSSGEAEVVAVKSSRRGNAEDVRIEVVRHAEGVTICAVYPNSGGRANTCEPGNRGNMNVRNNDTEVEFTVRVPSGVRFNGRTVNGRVEANNLTADVDATTVNGNVEVTTTGLASAKTVNGSITVSMGNANWTDELEFKTVNGSIDLSMPASLSAELEAKTLNGEISTDFPLTVQGTFGRRHMRGTIGGGGRSLQLETVNGSVNIRRAS
ncbi:MAG TPA: DUF4097 family beta strand repeat-containing protein [Pyrinomonadaceae bacterium]|jgi:DUF4097 and DUF4098 domain-containing protein YvlB|nr:DUF4097 family beta strand repeat-containing protein [Pyrinomonadaceae bacterium]